MHVEHYTALLLDACKSWPSAPPFRVEEAHIAKDAEEELVSFLYWVRSSPSDATEAYAWAESIQTMLVNSIGPLLEASGSRRHLTRFVGWSDLRIAVVADLARVSGADCLLQPRADCLLTCSAPRRAPVAAAH
jgi:hypothetical protein